MESGITDHPTSSPISGDTPLLTVQDLSVEITGGIPILDQITLTIPGGHTLGLVGESGSGKSMTALAVMGLLPDAANVVGGDMVLNGEPLTDLKAKTIAARRGRDMAMIFQEPMSALNPVFTVGDQIAEVYRLRDGASRASALNKAVAMMDRVGIADAPRRAEAYPHQLSGGMRQRVMIAMAMALRPKLLICDEPTTALDVTVQAQILDLILDLQSDSGMGVLFITHDLSVVSEITDSVAVMYAGRIVEEAPAAEFFKGPKHPYAQALMASLPGATPKGARLMTIPGVVPSPNETITGCRFHPRCPAYFDRCHTETPPLLETEGQGKAACWLES